MSTEGSIEALYDELCREAMMSRFTEVELSFSDLQPSASSEEVLLLYDLLFESVTVGDRYVDVAPRSEETRVEASALSRELERYQQRVEQPLFSLKGRGSAPLVKRDSAGGEVIVSVPLGIMARMIAAIVDILGILTLAVGIAYGAVGTESNCPASSLQAFALCNRSLLLFSVSLAPVVALVYHLLCLVLFGSSCGLIVAGGAVVNAKGRIPSPSSRIAYSAAWPLSMLLFGWLPTLVGQSSLHERLSASRVVTL